LKKADTQHDKRSTVDQLITVEMGGGGEVKVGKSKKVKTEEGKQKAS
jgi:hypothetical protein